MMRISTDDIGIDGESIVSIAGDEQPGAVRRSARNAGVGSTMPPVQRWWIFAGVCFVASSVLSVSIAQYSIGWLSSVLVIVGVLVATFGGGVVSNIFRGDRAGTIAGAALAIMMSTLLVVGVSGVTLDVTLQRSLSMLALAAAGAAAVLVARAWKQATVIAWIPLVLFAITVLAWLLPELAVLTPSSLVPESFVALMQLQGVVIALSTAGVGVLLLIAGARNTQ